jgi:hypothetical protein
MQDRFLEISPGYLIPIDLIKIVRWKDNKLRIAYDKSGTLTTVEVENVRESARYLYDKLRDLAITYETGPEFQPVDEDYGDGEVKVIEEV